MRRNVVGPVLVVIVAVGLSACGSTHAVRQSTTTRTTTTAAHVVQLTLPHEANLVILPPSNGAGNAQFGTFTASGTVYFKFSCKGKGPLTLADVVEHISPCDSSPTGASVPYHAGERVHLAVRAKPGTTWRLAVGEHVPGTALVLAHRTGAGKASLGARCRHVRPFNSSPGSCKASLGTFRLHGILHVVTSCTGPGQLIVSVSFLSKRPDNTFGDDYCPMNHTVSTFPATDRSVRVAVTRAPKGTWEVTLRETPAE
jgi:hypothetical protein